MMFLKKVPKTREDTTDKRPLVVTAEVETVDDGITIVADGVVVPFREIEIAAQVAGRVVEKSEDIRAGSFVAKGTQLLLIDPTDYHLDIERFEHELEQADQAIVENKTENENISRLLELSKKELTLQEKELVRAESLVKTLSVSESEADQARRATLVAETAAAQLENQISLVNQRRLGLEAARDRAKIALKRAEIDLERTKIVAPVDGVIVEAPVEKDSYVTAGKIAVKLEDTTFVEVLCHLRTNDLYWLWQQESEGDDIGSVYKIPKAQAKVVYRLADQEYCWDGVLVRYDGSGLDPQTRTVPCRVEVSQPKRMTRTIRQGRRETTTTLESDIPVLLRGMFVSVEIAVRPTVPLLKIPESSLQPGNRVFVVENGKLKIVPVEVVRFEKETVTLRAESDFPPGTKVVRSPLGYAENGMDVKMN